MRRFLPYLVAVGAVAVALALRLMLNPWLGENRPFILFLAAVAVSAWFGSTRAGIFSVVLGYLVANIFLIHPIGQLDFDATSPVAWINLLTFVFVAAFIIGPIAALRRSQAETEAAAAQVRMYLAQAEEAQRHKDRFLATLSHELRGPLSTLTNAVRLLVTDPEDRATARQATEVMERQVRQMTRLIDDLMDLSRVAQGRIELEQNSVDVAKLVSYAVESTERQIADRTHQLNVELPSEPLLVEGDEVRLTQVLTNLLGNAAKYTARGGMIWITAGRDRDRVFVRVRDNGPGIPRDKLATIFEMFSQLNGTLHRAAGGLGIGLFLARQIVDLHHGQIEAHSDGEGRGTEFVVSLPALGLAAATVPAVTVPTATAPTATAPAVAEAAGRV